MKLTDFNTLTFDCYGTLIDWESGIYDALKPWLEGKGLSMEREAVLVAFGVHESACEAETPGRIYSQLLGDVLRRLGKEWDVPVSENDAARFGASVADWPAFKDTKPALHRLRQRFGLVILSNVDNESFKGSRRRLGAAFDAVFTAEDIRSYKPDPRNFAHMLEKLGERGIGKSDILHTAQSLYHDHVPAKAAGLATCWIDRRAGKGRGATKPVDGEVKPDFRFASLSEMADAVEAEKAG